MMNLNQNIYCPSTSLQGNVFVKTLLQLLMETLLQGMMKTLLQCTMETLLHTVYGENTAPDWV